MDENPNFVGQQCLDCLRVSGIIQTFLRVTNHIM